MVPRQKDPRPCYLVASDETYCFANRTIYGELGAFLHRLDDVTLAKSLIELYAAEHPDREFDLTVVLASSLSAMQLVLVHREINFADEIALNLDSDEYCTDDPIYAALGKCSKVLGELEGELRHVLEKHGNRGGVGQGDTTSIDRCRLLIPIAQPQFLDEALNHLHFALERHRLIFIHFAGARRMNPQAVHGPTGMLEQVRAEEIQGHETYFKEVESEGEFLFKNRWFLDKYADEALSRFGPGEGIKPDVDGATYPYWAIDDEGVRYLQESSNAIHVCVSWLRGFDSAHYAKLVSECLRVAYDHGRPRWYSSIAIRWQYLTELDEVIAAAQRAIVLRDTSVEPASEAPPNADSWYYLQVAYNEATYNWDDVSCGSIAGDPNYLPVDSGTWAFFRVRGEQLANRLVRLFDRHIKPQVEREDETRIRVSFSCVPETGIDADERFLLDEQIEEAKETVERLDHDWAHEASRSFDKKQRRPLEGEMLSCQRLYDQARRWCERLQGAEEGATEGSPSGEQQKRICDSSDDADKVSDDLLRAVLPTAVMAAIGLRDLSRIRTFYPGVIPEEEAQSLHARLAESLESAIKVCKLEEFLEVTTIPLPTDFSSGDQMGLLMGGLAICHPDPKIDPSVPNAPAEKVAASIKRCEQDVEEPVRSILDRLVNAMVFDCRLPAPAGDESFQEPQRYLQMFRTYWAELRRIVMHHIEAPASYQPHPLMPVMVNLKARIDQHLDQLADLAEAAEVRQTLSTLFEIVSSGEPDDLQAVPEWSREQVGRVDRFIEQSRLALGAKSYPMTPAEEMCLRYSRKLIEDYEQQVTAGWQDLLARIDAKNGQPAATSSDSGPATSPAPPESETPRFFEGGTMVFHSDRVELCGVDICSGPRLRSRRVVLELLSRQRTDGSYLAYSGGELESEAKKRGAKGTAGRWIDDLRDAIKDGLLAHANIECGDEDAILSRGVGYRLAECVVVEFADPPTIRDIRDMEPAGDVPNEDVPNVLNDPNHAEGKRQEWILGQLGKGIRLKAPDVAQHFQCSPKTARRDLGALKDAGLIDYVGSSRTGYYRLCDPPEKRA